MSGQPPAFNPYAPQAPQDEFVASSYDQYTAPSAHQQQQQVQAQEPQGGAYELQDQDQNNYAFFNEVDDIKRNLVQYEDNIERVEGLHKRSLAESNVESEAIIQRQLDGLQSDTRGLAVTLKDRIKQLEATSQHDATKHAHAENLKHQFMAMIQKFQATEAAFRQRYRDVAARQYRIVDPEANEQQVQAYIDDEQGGQVFSQALQQSNRRGEARAALTEVQTRHREIQKIEATMTELAQLFHDMELMVAEQDQQVTNIETNVYGAQGDIEKGVDNQHTAIKKAKAWRQKKWWCVLVLIIILLFIALFFGIFFGLHKEDDN